MKNNLLTPVAILAMGVGVAEATPKKPNVILIMADDLGWGDVGFNGNNIIQTPNMDKMASEGLILDRFYSASAVSSPTRFSVLTGRNPYRSGIFYANIGILRPEEITLPELLKSQGYTSAHFGKWHLGSLTTSEKDANRGRVGNTNEFNPPSLHGYDDAFVTENAVPTWDPSRVPLPEPKNTWSAIKEGDEWGTYRTSYWDFDGNKVTDNLDGCDSRVVMDRVIPFIEENKENPFLAVVWFHAPHAPVVAGPEFAAMYSEYDENYQNYAGCITAMDVQIGRLDRYLKENNLDENTIIWFCSDNGPASVHSGVTGGHLGQKGDLHEGGVRVPAFVRWTNNIGSGERLYTPMYTCDYLPTIAKLAGVKSKSIKHELDGIDVMDIIKGKSTRRDAPFVMGLKVSTAYQSDDYKLYMDRKGTLSYDIMEDRYEKSPIENDPREQEAISAIEERFRSYEASFVGDEFEDKSTLNIYQKWTSPLLGNK